LLLPFAVGVAGNPAAIGVITGVLTPTNSIAAFEDELMTHTSPDPSTARDLGATSPPIYPPVPDSTEPELENSVTLPLPRSVIQILPEPSTATPSGVCRPPLKGDPEAKDPEFDSSLMLFPDVFDTQAFPDASIATPYGTFSPPPV
jgi:hypothetical protein